MSKYLDAADILDRQVQKLQGLTDARDALRDMGLVESTLASLHAQVDETTAELQRQRDALSQAQQTFIEAQERAAHIRAELDTELQHRRDDAAQETERILHAARDQAAQELESERSQRGVHLATLTDQIAMNQDTLTHLQSAIVSAQDENAVAQETLSVTKTNLAAIQAMAKKLAG